MTNTLSYNYSGYQKSEVCHIPTEAYAISPRRPRSPMPEAYLIFLRKAIYFSFLFANFVETGFLAPMRKSCLRKKSQKYLQNLGFHRAVTLIVDDVS